MIKAMKSRRGLPGARLKLRPWLLLFRLALWSLIALLLWCGFAYWTIERYNSDRTVEKADVGIVLGAALWNDVPSPALRERLEHAASLLAAEQVDKLILSGGLGSNGSSYTEAEGMQRYLLAKGVQPDKLLLESESTNTYENLLNSHSIVQEQGFNKVVIVTHDYHSARAKDIAMYIGYDDVQLSGTVSEVLNPYYNKGREVLAYTKWQLDKLLDWTGLSEL